MQKSIPISITLPPTLKDFVDTRVSSGSYTSVSEYFRELIRRDQRQAPKTNHAAALKPDAAEAKGKS